jgi:intracellular septation protein A
MSESATITPASLGNARLSIGMVGQIVKPIAIDLVGSLFFAGLYVATHDLILSAVVGMAAGGAAIGWRLFRRQPIAAMQWASLGLVLVSGALAILTGDPRIVMLKPTLFCAVIGAAMLQPGWMRRYAPPVPEAIIPARTFDIAGYFWAGALLATAAANLYFALVAGPTAWAIFVAVWPLSLKIGGAALQFLAFSLVARINKRRLRALALATA